LLSLDPSKWQGGMRRRGIIGSVGVDLAEPNMLVGLDPSARSRGTLHSLACAQRRTGGPRFAMTGAEVQHQARELRSQSQRRADRRPFPQGSNTVGLTPVVPGARAQLTSHCVGMRVAIARALSTSSGR